jgi:tetratricopeptide (TPR) repeat protein
MTLVVAGGCREHVRESTWFAGGFEEARAAARAHDTLLFLYFRNDSCIPCRRLDAETYSDPEVASQLSRLVALKLDPGKNPEHQALYERYGVRFYPALIFADAEGRELDRLGRFLTAEEFLQVIERIRSGDTFVVRLERFDGRPEDPELLRALVDGLLARGDLEGAYERIDAFQAANLGLSPDPSIPILLRVLHLEFKDAYRLAAHWYGDGWQELPETIAWRGAPAITAFLRASPATLERGEQARRLREARHEDAGRLIDLDLGRALSTNDLYIAAEFAYENGHYETAVGLFRRWRDSAGDAALARRLHEAAWYLYLCDRDLDTAIEMARAAYEATGHHGVADTLAQLLFVSGAVDEAIELETRAVAQSEGEAAEALGQVLERMKAGEEPYPGRRPRFESYPEG